MTATFPIWDVPTVPVAGDRLDGGIDGLGTLAIAIAPAVA